MSGSKTRFEVNATGINATDIIDPIDSADFFANYWAQKPLHIARTNSNPFSPLIDIQAIETLLSTQSLSFPSVQLSHSGQIIPVDEYTDDNRLIVAERIVQRYQAGSTIVMSHAHKLHPPLMEFCRLVHAQFRMPCQTNVYLSPPGKQGFNPHHDTHDVFILQVSGKKTFSFYQGGAELPTRHDQFNSEVHAVGDKTEEIELNAGDTLYIPRGFVHDALAHDDVASLHITLGVYPVLVHTLATQVINHAMQTDVRLRASLDMALSRKDMADQLKAILLETIDEAVVADALATVNDENALDAKQSVVGQLTLGTVAESSVYSVNTNAVISLDELGEQCVLRVHGSILEFDNALLKPIEWLLAQTQIRPTDIPDLNANQQRALVERLHSLNVLQRQ